MTEVAGATANDRRNAPGRDEMDSVYQELQALEALQNAEEADSALRQARGETGDQQTRATTNTDASKRAPSGDSAEDSGVEKPMGRANLLNYLRGNKEELPEGAAEQAQQDQRQLTRLGQENAELKSSLQEMREEMAELRGRTSAMQQSTPTRPGQQPQTPLNEDEQLLANMTPQQQKVLEAWARKNNLVTQDALDATEEARRSDEYTRQAIDEGLSKWGEAFGSRNEDGTFTYHEEIAAPMQATLSRVTEGEGVSPSDLFKLTFFDQLLEAARDEALEANGAARRNSKLAQAATMRNSAPGGAGSDIIYDKESGDTGDDVTDRALLSALRAHGMAG